MKKVIGILLVLCLAVAALAGCGDGSTPTSTQSTTGTDTGTPTETAASNVNYYQAPVSTGTTPPTFKIGFSYWSFADVWGTKAKQALEFIGQQFGCEIVCKEWAPPYDTEGILSTHNALIQDGCQGIIATYVSPGLIQASQEANVPIVQFTVDIGKDQSLIDMANASSTYLGSISSQADKLGWDMAQGLYDSGARKWLVGSSPAGQYAIHDQINRGIHAFLDEHSDVTLVQEVRDATTFADTMRQGWIANPDVDGIVCSVNNGDTLAALEQDNMVGKIKVSILSSPEGTEHYMEEGLIVFNVPDETSPIEIAFAELYNALSGYNLITDKITPVFAQVMPTPDLSVEGNTGYIYAHNVEEFRVYNQYIFNNATPAWTGEEIKAICPAYNTNATLDSIKGLFDSYTITEIAQKNGYTPS